MSLKRKILQHKANLILLHIFLVLPSYALESGFICDGVFETTFAGKHSDNGKFLVRASNSNALIDVTYGNGFREITGTDGNDSFNYCPITKSSPIIDTKHTNSARSSALATISPGRYPKDIMFEGKVLWISCVNDSSLLTNVLLHREFRSGYYNDEEVTVKLQTNSDFGLISSIRWYGPNYDWSKGHYRFVAYPAGWLISELRIDRTNAASGIVVPCKITYTKYAPQSKVQGSAPESVTLILRTVFSVENAKGDNLGASFIPTITNKTAHVEDRRIGKSYVVSSSGKWWEGRELLNEKIATTNKRRSLVVVVMVLFSIVSTAFVLKMIFGKKKNNRS